MFNQLIFWCKVKNDHHNFPEPKVTPSNCLKVQNPHKSSFRRSWFWSGLPPTISTECERKINIFTDRTPNPDSSFREKINLPNPNLKRDWVLLDTAACCNASHERDTYFLLAEDSGAPSLNWQETCTICSVTPESPSRINTNKKHIAPDTGTCNLQRCVLHDMHTLKHTNKNTHLPAF